MKAIDNYLRLPFRAMPAILVLALLFGAPFTNLLAQSEGDFYNINLWMPPVYDGGSYSLSGNLASTYSGTLLQDFTGNLSLLSGAISIQAQNFSPSSSSGTSGLTIIGSGGGVPNIELIANDDTSGNAGRIALNAFGGGNDVQIQASIMLNAQGSNYSNTISLSSSGGTADQIVLTTDGDIYLSSQSLTQGLLGLDSTGRLVNVTFTGGPAGYQQSNNALALGFSNYSPGYTLDVDGNAHVGGPLYLGNVGSGGGYLSIISVPNGASANTYSAADGTALNTYETTDRATQYLDLLANGTNTTSGIIRFLTKSTTSNSAPVERMRVDNAGNVGIGTSSPSATLQVVGTTAVQTFSATAATIQTLSATTYTVQTFSATNWSSQSFSSSTANIGAITISGSVAFTNTHSAIRVFPAGDLPMGTFSSGQQP